MTIEQIQEILKAHAIWLANNGQKGERANLYRADLCGANLRRANLCRADLRRANLCRANLSGADLSGADLSGADLRRANLCRADLRRANLCRADLFEADLSGADLSGADLSGADLSGADLRRANLRRANLCRADLSGADLRRAIAVQHIPMACPSEGSFIGWKKARNMIIKLQIPEDAKRSSSTGRKCRCDKAVVLAIESLNESPFFCKNDSIEDSGVLFDVNGHAVEVRSDYDYNFIYKIGETVSVNNFDTDRFNECAPGIHFFVDRQEAVNY